MQYDEAVNTLVNGANVTTVVLFLIACMLLLILASNAAEAWRKLFGKKPAADEKTLAKHCEEADERFKRDEKHISENHDNIADLKEGQRVICIAVMALLNHDLHNGNADEMTDALNGINSYLINRK